MVLSVFSPAVGGAASCFAAPVTPTRLGSL